MSSTVVNTLWVLLAAFVVVGGGTALIRSMAQRARRQRRGALTEQQPDLTHSAWQNLTQRHHRNRLEALREWMDEHGDTAQEGGTAQPSAKPAKQPAVKPGAAPSPPRR